MGETDSTGEPEVLDTGPSGPRRPVWIAIIIGCCCLIIIGLAWRAMTGDRPDAAGTPTPRDRSSGTGASPAGGEWSSRSARTAKLDWLRSGVDYDIFLRTAEGVVRINPKAGRIIRTTVPGLASSGPVSFVPIDNAVLIHPLDLVPGYRIPDDDTARKLPAAGGVVRPGPDGRHVWAENDHGAMVLVAAGDDTMKNSDTRIKLPSGIGAGQLLGDGHGYLLGTKGDGGAVYRLRPDGSTKLSIGRPIAVGPTRILGVSERCVSSCAVTELGNRFRKVSQQPRWRVDADRYSIGPVSADGRTAAVIGRDQVTRLIDLDSGDAVPAHKLRASSGSDQLAFSPDGRWLFGLSDDGHAYAVDVRTGRSRLLLKDEVGVQQLAVRT